MRSRLEETGMRWLLHTVDGRNPAAPDMYETLTVNNGRNYHFSQQQYHYHQFTNIHNVNDVVTHQLPENWTTESGPEN